MYCEQDYNENNCIVRCNKNAEYYCIYCDKNLCVDCAYLICEICGKYVACYSCGFPIMVGDFFAPDLCTDCSDNEK